MARRTMAALVAALLLPAAHAVAAAAVAPPGYLYNGPGYIPDGGDIFSGPFTLDGAEAWCSANSSCLAFTFFSSDPLAPNGTVYFKSQTQFVPDEAWQSYFRVGQPFVTLDAGAADLFPLNPLYLGVHLDLGYVQQPRGLYAQLIYGESFEQGTTAADGYAWQTTWSTGAATGSASLDPSTRFNNRSSLKLTVTPSRTGSASTPGGAAAAAAAALPPSYGLTNRGIGNEGLSLSASPYEGYLFVLAPSGATVLIGLNDHTTATLLDSATLVVPASPVWQRVDFTLHPSSPTTCAGIVPGSDPTIDCGEMGGVGHICVRCGGEFVLALASSGSEPSSTAHIGYVYLQPGPWGTFAGLPVLASGMDLLRTMGVTAIRAGGSFSNTIRWKEWRGDPWTRPSMQETWKNSLLSGFGPFEVVDMANAAGMLPVITLAWDQAGTGLPSVQEWADLVEYAWGDATTPWGRVRILNDSHPLPYNVTVFELGNELYNPSFVDQVVGMEAAAVAVGKADTLVYLFPGNEGLNASDRARAKSLLPASALARIAVDCHVGGGGGVECAEAAFEGDPTFPQTAMNCETNAFLYDMERALQEATDLMDWWGAPADVSARLRGRMSSFAMERSGHFDTHNDQGLAFFLPNQTWLQPPGWTHAMIAATSGMAAGGMLGVPAQWQTPGLQAVSLAAQRTADGSALLVFAANTNYNASWVNISIAGMRVDGGNVTAVTLSALSLDAANPAGAPRLVSPVSSTLDLGPGTDGGNVTLPPYSFTVLVFEAVGGGSGEEGLGRAVDAIRARVAGL
jgi:hypothetical protein